MKKYLFQMSAIAALAVMIVLGGCSKPAANSASTQSATAKQTINLGVSIYTGWQPWYSGDASHRLQTVFAKHGLNIVVHQMSYPDSITGYNSPALDAVVITNMDTLISPANSGVDSTAVIVGDFSNGNDKWETRDTNEKSVCDEKGKTVWRLEASVSDYLIERGLQSCNMHDSDIKLKNVSDDAIEATYKGDKSMRSAVTWNPMALDLVNDGNKVLFDSSKIPGEILDLLVVKTDVLRANPEVGKAFAEFWYNEMKLMQGTDKASVEAQSLMAATAKNTLPFFLEQLKTTAMFYTPQSAVEFTSSDEFVAKNKSVFEFCAERKLIPDTTSFGISFPNGQVLGNKNNIKFRYDTSYMQGQR